MCLEIINSFSLIRKGLRFQRYQTNLEKKKKKNSSVAVPLIKMIVSEFENAPDTNDFAVLDFFNALYKKDSSQGISSNYDLEN